MIGLCSVLFAATTFELSPQELIEAPALPYAGVGSLLFEENSLTVIVDGPGGEASEPEIAVTFDLAVEPWLNLQGIVTRQGSDEEFLPLILSGRVALRSVGEKLVVSIDSEADNRPEISVTQLKLPVVLHDKSGDPSDEDDSSSLVEDDGKDCAGGSCSCTAKSGGAAEACCPAGKTPKCTCDPCCCGTCVKDKTETVGGTIEPLGGGIDWSTEN